jgi:hypothetical protein
LDNRSPLFGRIRLHIQNPFRPTRNPADSDQPPVLGIFPDLIPTRHDGLLLRDDIEVSGLLGDHPSVPFLAEDGLLSGRLPNDDKTPGERRPPDAPQNNITRHVWSQWPGQSERNPDRRGVRRKS